MELQEEEREVLLAIYDGDPAFHQKSPITYQYKYGEEGNPKSFLLEICWGDNYPNENPMINMDTFYNNHINETAKHRIRDYLIKEAKSLIGSAMTYSLIESIKEKIGELIEDADVKVVTPVVEESKTVEADNGDAGPKKSGKKDQLSKSQKRKMWDRVDNKGERRRGWDWVDVIHHLAQTGSKNPENTSSHS